MGILDIFRKLTSGFMYVVDMNTLEKHLQDELKFSIDNNLEASANLYTYVNGEKHHLQIWNYGASDDKQERDKGIIYYYDDLEYKSIEEVLNTHYCGIKGYFKIELIDFDNNYLNEYKKAHPELKVEDY